MIADMLCPECHGIPDLLLVRKDHLAKKCSECGHKWLEEREGIPAPEPVVRKGGYVWRCAV